MARKCSCPHWWRGAKPGKTLLVTAGIHGDEFEGMEAIYRVFAELAPADMRGVFVAVPVVNPPAFEAGLRVNPDDRQDLARTFPGDPRGTVTEQIAHVLRSHYIRHADFFCDLHSAGQYYSITPWAGYHLHRATLEAQRQAARLFGLPIVWGTPGKPGRTLSAAAEFNVPAIYAEVRGEGRCRSEDVASYAHGIKQLLAHLEILPDVPAPYEPELIVENDTENAGFLQVQNRAAIGGLFAPQLDVGAIVERNQTIGVIRNALGEVAATVTATCPGKLVFLRTFRRVLPGDPLCAVLEIV